MSGGADAAKAEIDKLSRKASMLVDKIVETDDPSMVSVYEQHLKAISTEKVLLVEKSKKQLPSKRHFEEMYRTALDFLASPWKLWESDRLEHKRMVMKLVFPERVKYCQNEGYRTAGIALPFRVLEGLNTPNGDMVEPRGIEPLTSCMPCKRSPS